MLIARWVILLFGLAACVSAAMYILTRDRRFWVFAKRLCVVGAAAALVFFSVLILERLAVAL